MTTASASLEVYSSENGRHRDDERASVEMEAWDKWAQVTVEGPDGTLYNLSLEVREEGLSIMLTTSTEKNEDGEALFGDPLVALLVSEDRAEAENPVTGRLEQFVQA